MGLGSGAAGNAAKLVIKCYDKLKNKAVELINNYVDPINKEFGE